MPFMSHKFLTSSSINTVNNDIGYPVSQTEIEQTLESTQDGILILDRNGIVIMANHFAAEQLESTTRQLLGKPVKYSLQLETFKQKRFFQKAMNHFNAAIKGIPQHFNWIREKDRRPVKAFNILLNTMILDNQQVVIIRLIDITEEKILEWVLLSLAEICNHGGINDIIDDIAGLASKVFDIEHVTISLINNKEMAYTVSYFRHGIKHQNIHFTLNGGPCEEVKHKRKICHFNGDLKTHFPDSNLIKTLNVNGFLGGPLNNADGQVVGLFLLLGEKPIAINAHNTMIFRLFSERVSLEIERLLSQRKLQFLASIPQQDPNPVFRIEATGVILYTNKVGRKILDYWRQQGLSIPLLLQQASARAKKGHDAIRIELDVMDRIYLFIVVWVSDFDQTNIYATDITELKKTQQKMRNLANYDILTTVANRQFFETTVNQWLENAKKNKEEIALLLLDIDNFKTVNDTLGHPVGDKLLRILAKRVAGCIREDDFLARIGGDEFVVLLKLTDKTDIEKIASKINQTLAAPFEFGQYHLETACSIGISYYPSSGTTISELLRNADFAMYRAKKNGKNQYAFYANERDDEANSRLIILKKDLKNAIAKKEFYIDYQPQFDLISKKIVGFEAFTRWIHPKKGLISPSEFIPLAEQTGSIYALGYWTILQALKDYSEVISPLSKGKISLNIAVSQLNDQHFIDNLCNSLSRTNIPFESVILDISEQISTIQYRHLDTNLAFLNAEGIRLSLDNFGNDYSNLARLLDVPFNYLKIDHSLLHSIQQHPRQGAFIRGIIDLASRLQLLVIQKGVENAYQNSILKTLGCHYAQGFYYCRPMPINTLEKFIVDYSQYE